MKPLLFALALSAVIAAPAGAAISPELAKFLISAGLDPNSPAVLAADAEGPFTTTYMENPNKVCSLESFMPSKELPKGAPKGVKAFVATREFARKLNSNFDSTPVPTGGYDGMCMTPAERDLALKKVFP